MVQWFFYQLTEQRTTTNCSHWLNDSFFEVYSCKHLVSNRLALDAMFFGYILYRLCNGHLVFSILNTWKVDKLFLHKHMQRMVDWVRTWIYYPKSQLLPSWELTPLSPFEGTFENDVPFPVRWESWTPSPERVFFLYAASKIIETTKKKALQSTPGCTNVCCSGCALHCRQLPCTSSRHSRLGM